MKLCTLIRDSDRPAIVGTFCGWTSDGRASVKVMGRRRYIPKRRVQRAYSTDSYRRSKRKATR
jgi:hypothetical protein